MNPSLGDDLLGRPLALVVALALVSLLPFAFMSVTAFVKISTVLQIAKSAIGAQSVPSSTVIMALAGALTILAMAPVGEAIAARAAPLFVKEKVETTALVFGGIEAVREPLRDFLAKHASVKERGRFRAVAQQVRHDNVTVSDRDITVLVPAFVVSELTEAFAIGFLIFLPFLVSEKAVQRGMREQGESTERRFPRSYEEIRRGWNADQSGQIPQKMFPPHPVANGLADWMLLAVIPHEGKPSTGAAAPHVRQQLPPAPELWYPPAQSPLEQQLAFGMQLFDAPQYLVPPGHPQEPPLGRRSSKTPTWLSF